MKYIEWVGESFGDEYVERYVADYTGRRLRFKQGTVAISNYEYELRQALLDAMKTLSLSFGVFLADSNDKTITRNGFTIKNHSPAE